MVRLPFHLEADRIESLGDGFTRFVNQLLEKEAARQNYRGDQLRINSQEDTADGGVDASLHQSTGTKWLPEGDSAWQFKRSDHQPKQCEDELDKAEFAKEMLRSGAHYVLVIGHRLTPQKIKGRRDAIARKACEITGDSCTSDRVRLYDANSIASWANELPSLLANPDLGINLNGLSPYGIWADSRAHQYRWVEDEFRAETIRAIRTFVLDSSGNRCLRIEGPMGSGKTRLVMKALETEGLSSLVVYGPQASMIDPATIGYLESDRRTAVVVLDECDTNLHLKIAQQLTTGSDITLITVGAQDGRPIPDPVFLAPPMPPECVRQLVTNDFPELGPEAAAFIADFCQENVGFAIILATRLRQLGAAQAADLIRENDVEEVFRIVLPEGADFFFIGLLALFTRVGWDQDKSEQLELICKAAEVSVSDMRRLAPSLARRGLLQQQGRYRAVAPLPAAIFLAARMWESEKRTIVEKVIPALDRELFGALLERAAELGRYLPAQSAFETLIEESGLFESLEELEETKLHEFLTNLAIVAPQKTLALLKRLILDTPLKTLADATRARRDIVWALEKLAWHQDTFADAADCLMRLALAENEAYSNNATGTWIALFGSRLPATAASPDKRLTYLKGNVSSADQAVRGLVVGACAKALSTRESIAATAERQRGAHVQPRGSVRDSREQLAYFREALSFLRSLLADSEESVRANVVEVVIDAAPDLIRSPLRQTVSEILLEIAVVNPRALTKQLEKWKKFYRKDVLVIAFVDELGDLLPEQPALDKLQALDGLHGFGPNDDLHRTVDTLVREIVSGEALEQLVDWLEEQEFTLSFAVGYSLAGESIDSELVGMRVAQKNLPLLAGVLRRRVDSGNEFAFGEFAKSDVASKLSASQRVELVARGPEVSEDVPVMKAAVSEVRTEFKDVVHFLPRWLRYYEQEEIAKLLHLWLSLTQSKEQYRGLLDLASQYVYTHKLADAQAALVPTLQSVFQELLATRTRFKDLGTDDWDWNQVARVVGKSEPIFVLDLMLALISDGMFVLEESEESSIMGELALKQPCEAWLSVAKYLGTAGWKVVLTLGGWFTDSIPTSIVVDWIGDDEERAIQVAGIANPGSDEPTSLAVWLLGHFGGVRDVRSALAARFRSGSWIGQISARTRKEIEQMQGWTGHGDKAVRDFAREMLASLGTTLAEDLRDEEEGRF